MFVEFNGGGHFVRFRLEIPFLVKFDPKNQTCQFKLKIGAKTNSSMRNFLVVCIFSILDRKRPFTANLVHILKIVCLS